MTAPGHEDFVLLTAVFPAAQTVLSPHICQQVYLIVKLIMQSRMGMCVYFHFI
jgi:hypothetical protein